MAITPRGDRYSDRYSDLVNLILDKRARCEIEDQNSKVVRDQTSLIVNEILIMHNGRSHRSYVQVCIFFIIAFLLVETFEASLYDYPTAELSTSWVNGPDINHTIDYSDGPIIKALLLNQNSDYLRSFAFGFYCHKSNNNCRSFLLAIFIVSTNSGAGITNAGRPQVVWSANRNQLINENATLDFKSDGDLILKDSNGSYVWSTNTSNKDVVEMNLTETGNLVLVGKNNVPVWQSFDQPTDTLLHGQKFVEGQSLIANVSSSNWKDSELHLSKTSDGWISFTSSNPRQVYCSIKTPFPELSSFQHTMRLDSDGHLRLYEWLNSTATEDLSWYCDYPMVCGKYGISNNGQCICPQNSSGDAVFFKPLNNRHQNLGCSIITPLFCESSQEHQLLIVKDVAYFDTFLINNSITEEESCKNACLQNCLCKAAFFQYYGSDNSKKYCNLKSDTVYSMKSIIPENDHFNSTAFIKFQLQNKTLPDDDKKVMPVSALIGSIIGSLLGLFLIIGIVTYFLIRRTKNNEEKDSDIVQIPGMPTRFSYKQLQEFTNNFKKELGGGGFGTVFEGSLEEGRKIAVKRLMDGAGQGQREFLSEVETIGSVHHINLVSLIGFCSWKSHRLLVYEYMCKGSLDKWIFKVDEDHELIVKGLLYLHKECEKRIAHLDIKPENILLGENFDAKISDFGLSKLIDRDMSSVMTQMRGTRGYLAPEWLTSTITEKADLYSFGVVLVEIICGRKNLDYSLPGEETCLLTIFMEKAEFGLMKEFLGKYVPNLEIRYFDEAIKILKLAVWCLQSEPSKRISISEVVRVLDGSVNMDNLILDYNVVGFRNKVTPQQTSTSTYDPLLSYATDPSYVDDLIQICRGDDE
ncbi:Receptor-like kinase [Zostera marina]|uniref:Receptor-like serine/threonine-protein kinase n=1 Tax=Zostera marina TaxID=29655 RepID=A0A0K9P819_ZOSMR|nr:Receptor-like kinase [Zostera marina]